LRVWGDGFTFPVTGSFLALRHLIIYFNERYIWSALYEH
jgi:hypothetical protein